jgi:predicted ribosome quality control (RQC) complex YloA/Tae2 family protein
MARYAEPKVKVVELDDGWQVRIGCSDVDNDLLTFKASFPRDWWLHAKGCPGSHVVLSHAKEDDPPKEVLQEAARLALQHSKAKNASKGAVSVARIQDISKAKGAPTGQVQLRKSKTITVIP